MKGGLSIFSFFVTLFECLVIYLHIGNKTYWQKMIKRIYAGILRENFRALGYFADELIEVKSDFDFFYIITVYIVPLIRRSPVFERFYLQSIQAKDAYLKERNELEAKAPEEVERAFLSLQLLLENAGLLSNAGIKQWFDNISQVFSQKNRYGIPSYLEVVYEKQRHLLEQIFNMRRLDIVAAFATITYDVTTIKNTDSGMPEEIKKPYIGHFTFAPSLCRLDELNNLWRLEYVQHFWIAMEYLSLVEWCWNTPFSFFADKRETYEDFDSRNESVHLLSLHEYWVEINDIKNRRNGDRVRYFFCRNRFLKYLKLILNEVILEQEINLSSLNIISAEVDTFEPYSIELKLDDVILLLDVRWFADGEIHTYIMHSFHQASRPHDFIKSLINAPLNEQIDIRKISGAEEGSVAKYFELMKVNNMLQNLFFEKPGGSKDSQSKHESKNNSVQRYG